jgi:chromosome segregation ATPase
MSRPPLSKPPRGRDKPGSRPAVALESALIADRVGELERQLDERTRIEAALRDTSIAQIRRIAVLEQELQQYEARVKEQEEVGAVAQRQAHELEALRLSVDRAGAEIAGLEALLAQERATNQELTAKIEALETRLAQIKALLAGA